MHDLSDSQQRILHELFAAHPVPLDNVPAARFDLPSLAALLDELDELRSEGWIDYRLANLSGYDRVRELWLTPFGLKHAPR